MDPVLLDYIKDHILVPAPENLPYNLVKPETQSQGIELEILDLFKDVYYKPSKVCYWIYVEKIDHIARHICRVWRSRRRTSLHDDVPWKKSCVVWSTDWSRPVQCSEIALQK